VIPLSRTLTGRILLALVLSVVLHFFLLLSPITILPLNTARLPPIIAKLEPLPAARAKPIDKFRPAPIRPELPLPAPVTFDSAIPSISGYLPTSSPETIASVASRLQLEFGQSTQPAHPLPKHAQLSFTAYKGTFFPVGIAQYRLKIDDDLNYIITAEMNTSGVVGFFKTFELNQQSVGTLNMHGLRPDLYSETRNNSGLSDAVWAEFDWSQQMITFSNGRETLLLDRSQDMLSFMFQLSQLPLDNVEVPLSISNGKKLGGYELLVGVEEEIKTEMGILRALPINKMGDPDEGGMTIWLGLEYRLLPIKIRKIDRHGEIIAEMVISDLHFADE